MKKTKTNESRPSAPIVEWNGVDEKRPSAPIVEWHGADEERPSAPIVEWNGADEKRPSAPIVECERSGEERPSASIIERDGSETINVKSKDTSSKDILGEYCVYCKFKIADYCKTYNVANDSVKFCPNCGKPRITYRLGERKK